MVDDQRSIVFKSTFANVEVPTTPISPFVFRHAERLGDKVAIVDATTGASYTYRELEATAKSFSRGLIRSGVSKGSVVAILAPNIVEYPILFHGIAAAGCTLTTLNPAYTTDEVRHQLRQSGTTLLVTVPALLERAREATLGTDVRRVAVIGGEDADDLVVPFSSLLLDGDEPAIDFDPATQVVALPYSSGTTGLPKGVMLTHRNLLASMAAVEVAVPLYEDDVTLAVLPFFHIYGMNVIMNPSLASGATIVTMPRFDLRLFLQTIQDFKVTVLSAAPPMVLALAQDPAVDDYDVSSLRWLMSGAAPLVRTTATRAQERLGCTVFQAYGMTETSPGVLTTCDQPRPPESVGLLLPNWESRVVDLATGEDLDVGLDGEILVRGPQVMAGYFKNEEATKIRLTVKAFIEAGTWVTSTKMATGTSLIE